MVSLVYIRLLLALLVMAAIISIAAVVHRNGPHGSVPVRSANQQLPHNIDIALKKARFSEIQRVWLYGNSLQNGLTTIKAEIRHISRISGWSSSTTSRTGQ